MVDSAKKVADEMNATFLHVITNDARMIDSVTKTIPGLPTLVATSDKKLAKILRDREMRVKKLCVSCCCCGGIITQTTCFRSRLDD